MAPGRIFPSEAQRALGAPWPGYSLPGCFPAEPDSASPGTAIIAAWDSRESLAKNTRRIRLVAARLHRPPFFRKERPSLT